MTNCAAVVGSGPNGLVAACELARAGWHVTVYEAADAPGGAARSAELFGPGLISDLGASIHPLSAASLAYDTLLEPGALDWAHPGIAAAHAYDDAGGTVLLHRSLQETADGLGADAEFWRWVFGPLVQNWDALRAALFTPPSRPFSGLHGLPVGYSAGGLISRIPGAERALNALPGMTGYTARAGLERAIALAQLGSVGAMPATNLMRSFSTDRAKALFAGLAAHSTTPLNRPLTSAFGVVLGAAAHAVGWPAARGGTQKIVDALVAELESHGGRIVTGFPVDGIAQTPRRGYRIQGAPTSGAGRRRSTPQEFADVVILDLTPHQVLKLDGLRLPDRAQRRLQRWKYGPGAVKIDFLLDGPLPWSRTELAKAGTVHLGGSGSQIAASEAAVNKGVLPGRPYVLLAQPAAADDTRTPDHRTVCWAYAHVPHGLDDAGTVRAATLIENEISRYAPDFREAVLDRRVWGPSELQEWNPNLVGGSLSAGAATLGQTFAGPVSARRPYSTGVDGVYMCSAATPPGGGAHGMAGFNAARAVMREVP